MNDNLIPISDSKAAAELGRKGGINSGKARRRKADLRKAINALLTDASVDPKLIMKYGSGATKELELVTAMFAAAISGGNNDVKAAEWLAKYSAQQTKPDDEIRAIKRQAKLREELLQAQIDALKLQLAAEQGEEQPDDGFIDALRGSAASDWEGVELDEEEEV